MQFTDRKRVTKTQPERNIYRIITVIFNHSLRFTRNRHTRVQLAPNMVLSDGVEPVTV